MILSYHDNPTGPDTTQAPQSRQMMQFLKLALMARGLEVHVYNDPDGRINTVGWAEDDVLKLWERQGSAGEDLFVILGESGTLTDWQKREIKAWWTGRLNSSGEKGRIRLVSPVSLADETKVYFQDNLDRWESSALVRASGAANKNALDDSPWWNGRLESLPETLVELITVCGVRPCSENLVLLLVLTEKPDDWTLPIASASQLGPAGGGADSRLEEDISRAAELKVKSTISGWLRDLGYSVFDLNRWERALFAGNDETASALLLKLLGCHGPNSQRPDSRIRLLVVVDDEWVTANSKHVQFFDGVCTRTDGLVDWYWMRMVPAGLDACAQHRASRLQWLTKRFPRYSDLDFARRPGRHTRANLEVWSMREASRWIELSFPPSAPGTAAVQGTNLSSRRQFQ